MRKFLSPMAAMLILTACSSSGPDSSDVEKNIEAVFSSCPPISVEDVEKVNGIKESENKYTVDVKFTLRNNPSSENEELFEIYTDYVSSQKNEKRFVAMPEALLKAREDVYKYPAEMKESKEYKEKEEMLNKKEQEYRDAQDELNESRRKGSDSKEQLLKNFTKDCPMPLTNSFGQKLLFELFFPKMKDEKENIGKEFTKEITAKLKMVKTDNGWMIEELAR